MSKPRNQGRLTRLKPKGRAAYLAFAKRSGRLAFAFAVIMMVVLVAESFVPVAMESGPGYRWPDASASSSPRIDLHIQPVDVDLKSEVLRTAWFQLSIYTLDNQSFNVLLIWPQDFHVHTAIPPKFDNGTVDWKNLARIAFWELITGPENGAEPWPWQLHRTGEYPWDQYSFVLLFAFNRTVNIGSAFSYVSLSSALADEWKIAQSFEPLGTRTEFEKTLLSIGFSQQDISGGQVRRLPAYLEDYVDFYVLRITFVRKDFEILRGVFAFWVPATFLAALLIVAFGRIETLKISEALGIFLGIPLAALPFILSALQVLPSRPAVVESLFYGEVATSIAFATLVVAKQKLAMT